MRLLLKWQRESDTLFAFGVGKQLLMIGFSTLTVPEKKEAFVVDCHHLNGGRITRDIDLSRQTQDWGFKAFYSCFV